MFWGNSQVTYDLKDIATYAHGVGPNWQWLTKYDKSDNSTYSKFIEECHELGLKVHPYSLQDDFLKMTSNPLDEHEIFINKGIDGIFTEFPHLTQSALLSYHKL